MRKLLLALLAGCLLAQPALAAITFDNAADTGNNGSSGNFSTSYTGSTLTNGLLVMCIAGDTSTDSSPAATYNGVAMSLGTKHLNPGGTGRWIYEFYLLNPASGAHTLAITQTGGSWLITNVAEYAGVKQSAQPDATASNDTGGAAAASLTTAITVVNANSWAVLCGQNPGVVLNSGAGDVRRATDGAFANIFLFDSNAGLSAGAHNMTISTVSGTAVIGSTVVSFQPDTGASATIVPQLGLTGVGH